MAKKSKFDFIKKISIKLNYWKTWLKMKACFWKCGVCFILMFGGNIMTHLVYSVYVRIHSIKCRFRV